MLSDVLKERAGQDRQAEFDVEDDEEDAQKLFQTPTLKNFRASVMTGGDRSSGAVTGMRRSQKATSSRID